MNNLNKKYPLIIIFQSCFQVNIIQIRIILLLNIPIQKQKYFT